VGTVRPTNERGCNFEIENAQDIVMTFAIHIILGVWTLSNTAITSQALLYPGFSKSQVICTVAWFYTIQFVALKKFALQQGAFR
jgi:hypothetical protein